MEISENTCAITEQTPVIIKEEKDGNASSKIFDVKADENVTDSDHSIIWEDVEKKIECINLVSDEEKGEREIDIGKSLKKDILHENEQIKESSFPLPTTAPATTVSSQSSSCSSLNEKQTLNNFMTNIRISYDVEFLKELQNSPLAQTDPKNSPIIPSFTSHKKPKKRFNIKHIAENTEKKLPPPSNVVCELCGTLLGSKRARRSHNRMHIEQKRKFKQLKECTANEKSSLLNISSNLHNSSVDSNSHSHIQTSLNVNLKSDSSKKLTPATRLRFCEVCHASFKNRKQLSSHLYMTGHYKQSYKSFNKESGVEKCHSWMKQSPSDPPLIQPFVSVPPNNVLDNNFVGDPCDYRLLEDHCRSSQLDNRVTDRFGLLDNPHPIGPLGSSDNKHFTDSFNNHSRNLVSHSSNPLTGTNQRECRVANKGRIHKCFVCSEMFSDKRQFLNHKRVHSGGKKKNQRKKNEMEQFFSGKCREDIMERHIAKFILNIRRQVERHKLDVSLDNFMASKKLKLSCNDKERGVSDSTTDKISSSEKVKHVESCSINTSEESRKDSFISNTYKSNESCNTVKNNISDQKIDAKLICFIDTSKESTKIEGNTFVIEANMSTDACTLGENDNNKQPVDAKLKRYTNLSNKSNRREKNSFIQETYQSSKTCGVVKKCCSKKSIDSGSKCSVNTSNNSREVGNESSLIKTDKIGETTCSMEKNSNEQPVECTLNSLEENIDKLEDTLKSLEQKNILAAKQTSPKSKKRKVSFENSVTFDVLNNSKKLKTAIKCKSFRFC